MDIDGTDDYVEMADSPELRQTGDFTVEAWVNADSWPSGVMVILRKGESDSINYLLRKDADNLPSFQVKSTTSIDTTWWARGKGTVSRSMSMVRSPAPRQ